MSDSPPPQYDPQNESGRPGIRWDALAAIIASLVGLLALVVAGYTAYIERQQVRAQVWPYLQAGYSGSFHRYLWINRGVGPAVVKSVQVLVDGKPQQNWKTVQQALRIPSFRYHQSGLSGTVVSPGQTLQWLQFEEKDEYEDFRRAADGANLQVKVCYCSTLGDCWMNDSARKDPRVSVGQCPALPESQQFDD
ncbi:MAG TPA: hypothetical protein VFK29_06265 [Rhodanobacteraceae bacterium]|nr:hypothetical protein [Rhodanobacteraceae bacterium]